MLGRYSILFLIFLIALGVRAQEFDIPEDYTQIPKGYFMFPIKPGQRNYLAGTQGELRPNHFHGGLDIKTGGKEGEPVIASADGYVQRVKVGSYGYGWVLYVMHYNGYSTTYAHLKKFRKDIAEYVRSQQYNRESFDVDLFPLKNMLKVQKGDTIAWSGNSGSSGGPHLHFEIRDENNNSINPLLFEFDEILDNTRPTISKVALQCLDINSRIEGKYERKEIRPLKIGADYVINDTIEAYGKIGLDFYGYDRLDGASNKNGITYVALICNDSMCYEQKLRKFSFDEDRQINTHIDYKYYMQKGVRYQRCYMMDGNELSFCTNDVDRGYLDVQSGTVYKVQLSAKDTYLNESKLTLYIKGADPLLNNPGFNSFSAPKVGWTVDENVLKITLKNDEDFTSGALLYCDTSLFTIPVDYFDYNEVNYLWDLRNGLPDSVVFCNTSESFNFKKMIPSGQEAVYQDENVLVYFAKSSLLDTLYLTTEKEGDIYSIGNSVTPLFKNVEITLKDTNMISSDHEKTAVYRKRWGNSYSYCGGTWSSKGVKFRTKYLGDFCIKKDTIPPYIKLARKTSSYISFKISDELSGIKSFDAYLDGKWVLMNYDHKRALLWIDEAYWDEKITGDFKLVVKDNANNRKEYTTKFY